MNTAAAAPKFSTDAPRRYRPLKAKYLNQVSIHKAPENFELRNGSTFAFFCASCDVSHTGAVYTRDEVRAAVLVRRAAKATAKARQSAARTEKLLVEAGFADLDAAAAVAVVTSGVTVDDEV